MWALEHLVKPKLPEEVDRFIGRFHQIKYQQAPIPT